MNSLKEIKEKVARDMKFDSWENYAAIFPIESTNKLAIECWMQGYNTCDYKHLTMDFNTIVPKLED